MEVYFTLTLARVMTTAQTNQTDLVVYNIFSRCKGVCSSFHFATVTVFSCIFVVGQRQQQIVDWKVTASPLILSYILSPNL